MKAFDEARFVGELQDALSRLSGVPVGRITLTHDLRDDLGLDSLQSLELLSRLSDRWDLSIDIEDAADVRKVADVVALASRLAAES